MLNKEFLDVPFIISEIFKQILNTSLKHDHEFLSVKCSLAEVWADLSELKTSYGLDFFKENAPGFMLVSHIELDNLPVSVRREISHRVGNLFKQIFENYSDAIDTLTVAKKLNTQHRTDSTEKNKLLHQISGTTKIIGQLYRILALTTQELQGKLCDARGHNMNRCNKFTTYTARM